jgi:hypothetical protein
MYYHANYARQNRRKIPLFDVDRGLWAIALKRWADRAVARNSCIQTISAALKSQLFVYYQPAGSQIRDIVETLFLRDYFQGQRELIAEWRNADHATPREKFNPGAVRKALDVRGGLAEKGRENCWGFFCFSG